MMGNKKALSTTETEKLLATLKERFGNNMHRHSTMDWHQIVSKLSESPEKLWSLNEMEATGGAPDVMAFDAATGEFLFVDCSPESPAGRRSLCYDNEALASRKEHKPKNSALGMASEMGIELLDEGQYQALQRTGAFDSKTSSWLLTPGDIRKAGGAIFGDFRYGRVFIYHNGAESYYAARGFRGLLRV